MKILALLFRLITNSVEDEIYSSTIRTDEYIYKSEPCPRKSSISGHGYG